ncbi:MAG: DUF4198 domain-containing protein [Desulfovibrio sp.]|nr:DUF4198 domain-containing protein [Desulfovibrio sp.]
MFKTALASTLFSLGLLAASPVLAHFGLMIPSQATVSDKAKNTLDLTVAFIHPMEQNAMHMEKPKRFIVSCEGKSEDLLPKLNEKPYLKHKAWKAQYTISKPGLYQFAVEPEPYFEPAEDCFIVHYTKVIVPAFGEEEGWDEPLGLKTEIVPLTRPFGNYAGNVFQGKVLLDGKPVANCDVEVEYLNEGQKRKAPNDYFVTQVVKTDSQGVFTFVAPWAGWWGFAALNTAAEKMSSKDGPKEVELGAVLWTNFAGSQK